MLSCVGLFPHLPSPLVGGRGEGRHCRGKHLLVERDWMNDI